MSLKIEHYPNINFSISSFIPKWSVDLNKSVQKKLKKGEKLTNATALRILKQIKLESDRLSFLTKPIVLITVSLGFILIAASIPAVGIALYTLHLFFGLVGGMVLYYVVQDFGFFPKVSQAYRDQSERASKYIRILEAADSEVRFY